MINLVGKLGLGTVQFGMNYGIANNSGQIGFDEGRKILKYATKIGLKYLDTAQGYGQSERILGEHLKAFKKSDFSVVTKTSGSKNDIESNIEKSVKKLGLTPEVVLAHKVEDYINPDFNTLLTQIKKKYNISKIGVSIYTKEDIMKVIAFEDLNVIQCPLNVLDSYLLTSGTLDMLKEKNIEIHVRSVFLQGLFYLSEEILKQKFPSAIESLHYLREIAKEVHLTLPELSLLWVLSLNQVDKVFIGVDSLLQLKQHSKILDKRLDDKIINAVNSLKFSDKNVLNPSLWNK